MNANGKYLAIIVPYLFAIFSPNPHHILLNRLNKFHQSLLFGQIKQLAKALGFVKGRFHQFGDVFDVAVLDHVIDDLADEDDLGLVQGLVPRPIICQNLVFDRTFLNITRLTHSGTSIPVSIMSTDTAM